MGSGQGRARATQRRAADYAHVATEELPGGRREAGGAGGGLFPPEAAQWQCGHQRLALRRQFNPHEINVAELMQTYDVDHSRALEMGELKLMLQDYTVGRPPREEEVRFIMQVADRDHDQRISQGEVLFALKTWFAFRNMPRSVGEAFHQHGCSTTRSLLSVEELRELLLVVNEQQPVTPEEAAFVREMALSVGATEEKVTVEQLRKAVAAWYLHIERGETEHLELLTKAARDAHKRVVTTTPLGKLMRGEINYSSRGSLTVGGFALFVLVLLPCFEILVANTSPSSYSCEHPHLSAQLWSSGVLGLVLAGGLFGAAAASHYQFHGLKVFLWVFDSTVAAVIAVVTLLGASNVLWSSSARCGLFLWHFAHVSWIEVPFLVFIFSCCGLPILYFCMGSQEFIRNQDLDEGLMRA